MTVRPPQLAASFLFQTRFGGVDHVDHFVGIFLGGYIEGPGRPTLVPSVTYFGQYLVRYWPCFRT